MVVSPLVSLMVDLVSILHSRGISDATLLVETQGLTRSTWPGDWPVETVSAGTAFLCLHNYFQYNIKNKIKYTGK